MKKSDKVVAAFEVWGNGKTQTSAIRLSSRHGQRAVDDFITRHHESRSFAGLRTFTCEDEALAVFETLNREDD